MNKAILAIVLSIVVGGCFSDQKPCDNLRNVNRMNLNQLAVGMTEQEVRQRMGDGKCEDTVFNPYQHVTLLSATNPYKKEILQGRNKTFELLFYYTDVKKADNAITEDELTPLVFDNGKLIGWGWSFLDANVAKYEIRLR